MTHHPIFDKYERKECTGTGHHLFDFLGVATDSAFKKGWDRWAIAKGRKYTDPYPRVNEHYFDWIALLKSLDSAKGTFRMAELGAGWAPWLIRAKAAADQLPDIKTVKLLAVEAEPVHYGWVNQHFLDNMVLPGNHQIIHGAVSGEAKTMKFPKVDNPAEDYGASTRQVYGDREFYSVQGYTIGDILGRFDGPVDFVHTDIQGAEYDVFPDNMDVVNASVKNIMIGTHIALEKHHEMRELFLSNGWTVDMDFPRQGLVQTEYGEVQFGDGFLYMQNPKLS